MNSIVTNSPPIKDENYAKTASLLRVLSAASNGSQTPNSEDKNSGLLSDINANDQKDFSANRGAYIPFHGNYDESRNFQPVELQVTNLDQNIEQREMKKTITSIFREHVHVLHVSVYFQSDGNMAACVRVPTPQDAQYAISQLHRKKIGYKRILIARNDVQSHNPMLLRTKVISLLNEVPGSKLQLFKFREMYEKRYHDSIGVSDLYKMKDVVVITEEASGRMVQLQHHKVQNGIFLDSQTCPIHGSQGEIKTNQGWAEKENGPPLPNIILGLSILGPNIKNLIKSHGGSIPLATLKNCYEAEFEAFIVNNDEGVPLEHLVTAIHGINIQQNHSSGIKVLVANEEPNTIVEDLVSHLRSNLSVSRGFSGSSSSLNTIPAPPLASQLALFSRELVDLLKTSPGCKMPFHKFIPMYHHFFGRQCRVADYGYTKLKDLFEALPHVVQIIGEGSRAMITLSHRAQVKRFTSDLLKVLKGQPSKQISLYDLPQLFEKSTHKAFKINDYGVCEIEDLIADVSETSVVISTENQDGTDEIMISIPKREQTNEELARTHKFAEECIELLKHVPECRLPFNKFIPAYHHHFGRQCRVADYGFTKLIELFEAIPTTIEITEDADGERILQLTDIERLKVVGEHIAFLIKNHAEIRSRDPCLLLSDLSQLYLRQYGHNLRPENFGASTIRGIIEKLNSTLRLDILENGQEMVKLIDRSYIKILSNRVKEILADTKMTFDEFKQHFREIYNEDIEAEQLKNDLKDLINVEGDTLELVPLQICGIRIQNLLKDHGEKMLMSEFEAAFAEKYMTPLCPGQYGFPGLSNLLAAFPDVLSIRGRGTKKMICFHREGRRLSSVAAAQASASNGARMASFSGSGRPQTSSRGPPRSQFNMASFGGSGNNGGYRGFNSRQAQAPRSRPIPQMRFNQPPPNYGGGLGFGGSSGPGCGGGEFWAELAQFGIFPQSNSSLGTGNSATRSFNQASSSGRHSPSTAFGSPTSSPSFFTGNSTTSMLPTPHSPSPLLQNNRVTGTHFAFPPIWPSSSNSQSGYRRND